MQAMSFRHLIFLGTIMVVTLISTCGMVYTVANSEWSKSTREEGATGLINSLEASQGLWNECKAPLSGDIVCKTFGISASEVPYNLAAQRGMILAAIVLNIFSLALVAVEFECSRFKFIGHCIAGSITIISSILCFSTVSWYAIGVMCAEKGKGIEGMYKYQFGDAIYSGFASSGISLGAGILRLIYSCLQKLSSNSIIKPGNI